MGERRLTRDLTRDLLAESALDVAPRLLGAALSHTTAEGTVTVVLTEVEAYLGEQDPASHAFGGPTPRSQVMFGRAGHLYVYLSYGVHWCCNVVTGPTGHASAVLLRAGRVVEGAALARSRRGATVADRALARGPGCLGQALGIGRDDLGADLLDHGPLRLWRPSAQQTAQQTTQPVVQPVVRSGPRVGVSRAHEEPWRFWIDRDPTVSSYRRSQRASD